MQVREIMTPDVRYCTPWTDLAAATEIMWHNDCGILPVVEEGKVIGLLTDRDICMAVGTSNRAPSEVQAGDVITGRVYSCAPEDDVEDALTTMQARKVRRLPVIDGDGRLRGILSLNDVALNAKKRPGKKGEPSYDDVVETLTAICGPSSAGLSAGT